MPPTLGNSGLQAFLIGLAPVLLVFAEGDSCLGVDETHINVIILHQIFEVYET